MAVLKSIRVRRTGSWIRAVRCCSTVTLLLMTATGTWRHIRVKPDGPAGVVGDNERFEVGENATLRDILSWTRASLKGTTDNPIVHGKWPCDHRHVRPCVARNCSEPLGWIVEDRIGEFIFQNDQMLTGREIIRIKGMGSEIQETDTIFLTAAYGKQQFQQLQALMKHMHDIVFPRMKTNFTMLVVDIGLTYSQRELTKKVCNCTVYRFPNWRFPDHVKNRTIYAWKPILIKGFLPRATSRLVYMDTTVRLKPNFHDLFDMAAKQDIVLSRSPTNVPFPLTTLNETFDFFHENSCKFFPYPEVDTAFGVFQNIPFVTRVVVEPWASCALKNDCISPIYPTGDIPQCKEIKMGKVGQCHRFDKSALSLLLAKVFREEIHRVVIRDHTPYLRIAEGEKDPEYFKTLKNAIAKKFKL